MDIDEKRELVESYKKWWHSIDFGDGLWSNGRKRDHLPPKQRMSTELASWNFPKDYFRNKAVLDVGAWDGFFSFFAEQNGASSVTALDPWGGKHSTVRRTGFDIAKKALDSQVKPAQMDIMDATPNKIGTFDVILFAGVFYHLDDPYTALKILKDLLNNGGSLFIETRASISGAELCPDTPMMEFYPKVVSEGRNHSWYPNQRCLEDMIEAIGGLKIERLFGWDGLRACLYVTKTGG